jgi:hypothetical protein
LSSELPGAFAEDILNGATAIIDTVTARRKLPEGDFSTDKNSPGRHGGTETLRIRGKNKRFFRRPRTALCRNLRSNRCNNQSCPLVLQVVAVVLTVRQATIALGKVPSRVIHQRLVAAHQGSG